MDKYSVKSTHDALKGKLSNYIKTIYLGKNKALREACEEELDKSQILYQEPFIEANSAYKVYANGIRNSKYIPDDIKKTLLLMSENKLGVYTNPYEHQVRALEEFYRGNDLFVATGTGSGKTECFMWPMVSSLVKEASERNQSWQQRGVRALMLYPMNALVSDQLGRLRRMIGDVEGRFYHVFKEQTGSETTRIPQFGMYTGRTPYPGLQDIDQDKELAKTLEKDLLSRDETVRQKLVTIGKYPSKYNLQEYVDNLKIGKHITYDRDAELITRQEIQQSCPDVLITNYSMLEYMLIRPIEQSIWRETKKWLNLSNGNKLLFIIDEAHMYRGSSGGEVALLIRRLMRKLDIGRDKMRFILTSASIPSNCELEVKEFACNLSAQLIEKCKFKIIEGEREKIQFENSKDINPSVLADFNIDDLQKDEPIKIKAIKCFGSLAGFNIDNCNFSQISDVQHWLYDELSHSAPMLRIMQKCRGNATKFDDLACSTFPNSDAVIAQKATSAFLAIAPLAKNKEDQVLFPARLHMMFRGLQGLYACSNPHCSEKKGAQADLGTGRVYLGKQRDVCKCGGKIYELLNDRRCGALFLKGYIDKSEYGEYYVWSSLGEQFDDNLKEVHFYIIPNDISFNRQKAGKDTKVGWLNSITGRLYFDDTHANENGFIHVAYQDKEQKGRPNILTFYKCPKCNKQQMSATNFITKGNEPFFNLISEQLYIQPQTIFRPELLQQNPNGGRKVLLFSDSRQRAAVLAKDLTRAADEDAMKKALTVAAFRLQEWANKNMKAPTMDILYIVFLQVAYENNLRFFYGQGEEELKRALDKMKGKCERAKRRSREIDYYTLKAEFNLVPDLYNEQLLKQMCSSFRSLSDIGVCWVEPCNQDIIEEIEDMFDEKNIDMTKEEFYQLFAAWCSEIMTSSYAIGAEISDQVRRNITNINRFGLDINSEMPERFRKILSNKGYGSEDIKLINECLLKFTAIKPNSSYSYLNLSVISLKYGLEHEWFKCPQCGGVFPYTLWGKCVHCGEGNPILMYDEDFKGVNFWRAPVVAAVKGDKHALITGINTEEHTAQLSHKDQRQKMWSTTEDYEMRFQNVYVDNDRPVDVLSCTTTMEVGIDIGSLTAVGLRNIPPMRENYQQRAGRAGRRSAAISTIVTFTDNGPHDSYYFNNPEKIITGEPRKPWIDVNNLKLVQRHLNVICVTEFLSINGTGVDQTTIQEFFDDYFEKFKIYMKNKAMTKEEKEQLIPDKMINIVGDYKTPIVNELNVIYKKVEDFPENYCDDNNDEKPMLDVLLEEGFFPTYSFPRNVVGFYIEKENGGEIEQKPERALDIAISEYAPGRTVVVNKKTYKSGGIYNFHSKFKAGYYDKPARPYFESRDYFKTLYFCKNSACNWFGTTLPAGGHCPFCGSTDLGDQYMLKPWGFSAQNGTSIPEAEAESELTYAEIPCYSATPEDKDMVESEIYDNIRYAKRSDQPLIILNKGSKSNGFTVCKDCGAAVPGNDENEIKKPDIKKPFKHPRSKGTCRHADVVNVFLGHEFLTDMVVFEIALDRKRVNTEPDGFWINTSALTLAEAMVLAAGRMLDVEFNEIKSGYRLRYSQDKAFIDVFLFDSLSSGAGYCAALAERTDKLFTETRKILEGCNCDASCHNCLNHFWNQRVQDKLNRFKAIELLDWSYDSKLPEPLSVAEQNELLRPLKELVLLDGIYKIKEENGKLYICSNSNKKQIYIYPVMWNKYDSRIPNDAIFVSDRMVKMALPKAYSLLISGLQ